MGSYKFSSIFGVVSMGLCIGLPILSSEVSAQTQYASHERATVARAHMSRARTLLVEALAEFEESKKYARPDMLIDSEDWRLRVISLTEQLNRVVDPQPKVTREGAVFRVPPRFVRRQKEQLPDVADGAKSRSDIGERARLKQKQQERAQFFSGVDDQTKVGEDKKGNLAKLPLELQLPDEPVLDSNGASKKAPKSQDVKSDLFTNELMPEIEKSGPSSKTIGQDSLVPPQAKVGDGRNAAQNTSGGDSLPDVEDDFDEVISEIPSKSIVPSKSGSDLESEIEESNKTNKLIERNEELKGIDSELDEGIESNLPEVKSKPSIVEDEALTDTSGSYNGNSEVDDEASSENAAKQLSEDEELAKRLEDSISKSLSERRR